MKVKINDAVYDSEDMLIMIKLTNEEKKCISMMSKEDNVFSCFPEYIEDDEIKLLSECMKNFKNEP